MCGLDERVSGPFGRWLAALQQFAWQLPPWQRQHSSSGLRPRGPLVTRVALLVRPLTIALHGVTRVCGGSGRLVPGVDHASLLAVLASFGNPVRLEEGFPISIQWEVEHEVTLSWP